MVAYSFKKQFVDPIKVGLGVHPSAIRGVIAGAPKIHPKRQTIRAIGKRRHARQGEILQLYYGMRTKQCTSIGVARCTDVVPIRIRFDDIVFWIHLPADSKTRLNKDDKLLLAMADGFGDEPEMHRFWLKEHKEGGAFDGLLIKWEPIR